MHHTLKAAFGKAQHSMSQNSVPFIFLGGSISRVATVRSPPPRYESDNRAVGAARQPLMAVQLRAAIQCSGSYLCRPGGACTGPTGHDAMCLVAGTFLWRHSHDCDTCDVNVSLEVGSQQAQREQECCQSNTIMVEVHSQSSMPEVRMCPCMVTDY